jgi:hypothetical protein
MTVGIAAAIGIAVLMAVLIPVVFFLVVMAGDE